MAFLVKDNSRGLSRLLFFGVILGLGPMGSQALCTPREAALEEGVEEEQGTEPSPISQAQDYQPVRDHVLRVMEERGLPSVSVAVSRGGEILWEESFGWADVEGRIPATPHTPYSLASISKPMTATGVLLLRQEGRVDLDAPLDAYMGEDGLKGLAGPARDATVRRVLSHTAGLPLHYTFFYRNEDVRPPPPAETLRRYGVLVFPPGERFEYSNLGYGLLDFLIQNVSGEPYGAFMDRRVFRPLGLTRTSVGIPPGTEGDWARRYGTEGQLLPFYDFDHPGASAIFSSAHDLVRFGAFHLGYRIGSEDGGGQGSRGAPSLLPGPVLEEMQTPREPPAGNAYGLGWFVEDEYGFRKVFHTGSMPGVSTMLALYPEHGVAIVVLLNALDREQRVEIARQIAAVAVPGYRDAREQARRSSPEQPDPPDPGMPPGGQGGWRGVLATWEGEVSVQMRLNGDGSGTLALGSHPPGQIRDLTFRDGVLTGRVPLHVSTSDALRHTDHVTALKLVLRIGEPGGAPVLEGQATAQTMAEPSHFALSSYMRLTRER